MERLSGVTGRRRPAIMKRPLDAIPIKHMQIAPQTGRYRVTLMELYLRTSLTTVQIKMQLAVAATPDESTSPATGTKPAPGFDFVIFVFGLFAGILLARRHDK
jgi:hypothetical protein